ncbi:hypothetical protein V6N00_13760 [Tersicoccus sp. MR15.9]|uniref:hypothetical protein n=1 Tax=Tersicoccus mangrovi TaxID=3121635 RepID=UPI002FE5F240
MSNTIQPHKPKGVPGAGQFDTMPHTESAVSLDAPQPIVINDIDTASPELRHQLSDLDEQRKHIYEAAMDGRFGPVDRHYQRLSAKLIGTALAHTHPQATELLIEPNVDGERQFDVIALLDADGNEIDRVRGWEELGEDEGTLEETRLVPDDGTALCEATWAVDPTTWSRMDGLAVRTVEDPSRFTFDGTALAVDLASARALDTTTAAPAADTL